MHNDSFDAIIATYFRETLAFDFRVFYRGLVRTDLNYTPALSAYEVSLKEFLTLNGGDLTQTTFLVDTITSNWLPTENCAKEILEIGSHTENDFPFIFDSLKICGIIALI